MIDIIAIARLATGAASGYQCAQVARRAIEHNLGDDE
jgi:hypothetical protein